MANRFELPDVNFFEKAPEAIEQEMLQHIEERTGIQLDNADPRRKFVQGVADYIARERINADYSFKQNLLSYASGNFLDHKALDLDVPRLESAAAKTKMKIVLERERVGALLIPNGTRFMVGEIYFSTTENFIAAAGNDTVYVDATCTEKGTLGNGFLPGEISKLVDMIPWVKSVVNITETSGGADTEGDNEYAERIRIAPNKFSTAGPTGAYEYWAYTAHQSITDVKVYMPEAGKVDIVVLCKNGEIPTDEIIESVKNTCTDKKVRPLTDYVEVKRPEIINYDLHASYYISEKNQAVAIALKEQIESAYRSYLVWQKERIGRDKDFTELITTMKNAGASRVSITEELFTSVGNTQVAIENATELTFGGFTDE